MFRGNSFIYQAKEIVTRYQRSRVIGFDSWQGLPDEHGKVWRPSFHAKGRYAAGKQVVLSKLAASGLADDARFSFVDGFYSESLTESLRTDIHDVIFVNIDVDIYQSTIELLDFIKPLLRPGVILYWDDWKDPRVTCKEGWGEHLAWTDWSGKNTDVKASFLEENWINQRIMVVTEANGRSLSDCGLSMASIVSTSESMDSAGSKLVKAIVHNPPISSALKLGFQVWGRMKAV